MVHIWDIKANGATVIHQGGNSGDQMSNTDYISISPSTEEEEENWPLTLESEVFGMAPSQIQEGPVTREIRRHKSSNRIHAPDATVLEVMSRYDRTAKALGAQLSGRSGTDQSSRGIPSTNSNLSVRSETPSLTYDDIPIPMNVHLQRRGECVREARMVPRRGQLLQLRAYPRRQSVPATPVHSKHRDCTRSPDDQTEAPPTMYSCRAASDPSSSPQLHIEYGTPSPTWRYYEWWHRNPASSQLNAMAGTPTYMMSTPMEFHGSPMSPMEQDHFLGRGRTRWTGSMDGLPQAQAGVMWTPVTPSPTWGFSRERSISTCTEDTGIFNSTRTAQSSTPTRSSAAGRDLDCLATGGMVSVFEDDDDDEEAGLIGYLSGRMRSGATLQRRIREFLFSWLWDCWPCRSRLGEWDRW
ncbi:hypothetical protein P152DRAFT_143650 [Eremomyces bilateralis CBS 781.70]|uniref:Uncharacterized protein n=1 Tax=Eremomyces bilateralis CBS 781.70 TaxID=1392243 RepID=A0A6G1FWA8_9PEZI|nr:uncharacterized protein P152DRAFT_143650 [Eremomyces bilateralis CBS 781.70]KAF1809909.1 hypothetical protein P152DRAFT_143650 [Eremomyces bilateralis CBS 781.70]